MVSKIMKQETEKEDATERLNELCTDDNVGYKSSAKERCSKTKVCLAALFVLCLALAIIGIVLMITASRKPDTDTKEKGKYSAEAERVGLKSFIEKAWKKVSDKYHGKFDPRPENLKEATDESIGLLRELENMDINVDKLKLREKKSLEQVRHFLKHVFTTPYGTNYYAGDWMLGPNSFCWELVCMATDEIYRALYSNKLDAKGMKKIKKDLQKIGKGFNQYVLNMKYGVEAGMVRSLVACKAGLTSLERQYFQVKLKGAKGILEESAVTKYYESLMLKNNGSLPGKVSEVNEYLVQFVGHPIDRMLSYIRDEHLQSCVPTEVSSGLASLPLPYVYVNGTKNETRPTTGKLPTGEKINGNKTYEMIMSYFTTNDMTPTEVHLLGWKMLKSLYSEVVEGAKSFTGLSDTESAIASMKKTINSPEMFFSDSLPLEESDEHAQTLCVSDETAKKHCPTRWGAFSTWVKAVRELTTLIESKITHLFYFTGKYKSVPSCPVKMQFDYNPANGFQSYKSSTRWCMDPATYFIPFWVDRPGPVYRLWTVNAHEGSPGHHLQIQGYAENFFGAGSDIISFMDGIASSTAFVEGWGLYAESPLMARDTDLYNSSEAQLFKHGMITAQIWRALRLVVDTGFHYYGYKRAWGRQLFKEYAWMEGDVVEKELTRYQSNFGQATAYMIGQLHIHRLRNFTKQKLGDKFSLKDFHYQILSQGQAPLSYLQQQIEMYVECKQRPEATGCKELLSSTEERRKEEEQYRSKRFDQFAEYYTKRFFF